MKRLRLPPWSAEAALVIALFLGTFVLLMVLSHATGPAIHEQKLLHATRTIGQWIDRAPRTGSLFDAASRDAALGHLGAQAAIPAFISGAIWRAWSLRHHWLADTLALRSGFLLFQSLSLPALYLALRSKFGAPSALFAAAFALLVPRSIHLFATACPDALAVSASLVVIAAHVRSIRGGSLKANLVTAAAFGFALSLSPAVVWLIPVMLLHSLWLQRRALRDAGRAGAVPIPSAMVTGLVVAPIVFLAMSPGLWRDTAVRGRQFALGALAPSIIASSYGGSLVSTPPFPRGYALRSLAASLPTLTVILAGAGLAVIALEWWRSREGEPDRTGLAALLGILVLFSVAWPAVAPPTLAVFPPRWILGVPFVAAFAGAGAWTLFRWACDLLEGRSARMRRALLAAGCALILGTLAFESVRSPATLAAGFAPLFGGAAAMRESRTLPVHDASMAIELAPAIDSLGRSSVTVHAPELGQDVWEALKQAGRLRTQVKNVPNLRDADLLVAGGSGSDALVHAAWARTGTMPSLLGVVERDRSMLLALYRLR